MSLDERLHQSLGAAYSSTFGDAPASLPEPARRHAVPIAAGVGAVVVVAAVAVPLMVSHAVSETTITSPAGHGATLQTGTSSTAPVCGPGDVKLTAVLNQPSFKASALEQRASRLPGQNLIAAAVLTATGARPCRSYREAGSITFMTPSDAGIYVDGPACGTVIRTLRNGAGHDPVVDPLASVPCQPGAVDATRQAVAPSPTVTVSPAAPTQMEASESAALAAAATASFAPARSAPANGATPSAGTSAPAGSDAASSPVGQAGAADYGVLLSRNSLPEPSDNQIDEIRAGRGPSPEPVFAALEGAHVEDPLLLTPAGSETGTWILRVSYGNITADTKFQVTAG